MKIWYDACAEYRNKVRGIFMKTKIVLIISVFMILLLSSCSRQEQDLEDMASGKGDGYVTIVWGDKTYVPYCAISMSDRGKQIGIVDGDEDHRVYEYEGYTPDEWVIDIVVSGLMDSAMLMREINVTNIPEGLDSEYEWNNY